MKGIFFTDQYDPQKKNDNIYTVGIVKKIKKQISVFEDAGFEIKVYNPTKPTRSIDKILRRLPIAYESYDVDEDVRYVQFMYIRKPLLIDNKFVRYLKEVRRINRDIKILMEIPTYPYDDEIRGFKDWPFKVKDRVARSKLGGLIDVILTYSNDERIFGIKTIRLSNGIDFDALNQYSFDTSDDNRLHVVACACFNFYHGYDRAIEGLADYLKTDGARRDVVLDIVGEGGALQQYIDLVKQHGIQDNVIFHGQLNGIELARVYDRAVIGLDSMGRHRANVYYNSSLKGKEYCAYGLVIVSGVETELDYDDNFDYYYRIPADDSPMDWESVIEFYNCKTSDGADRNMVKEYIKQYAKSNFDMKITFKPVVDYLLN